MSNQEIRGVWIPNRPYSQVLTSKNNKCIDLNRKSGFQGQIFFHYEGLRKNNDAMAIALKTHSGFNQIAKLPGVSTINYLSQK